MLGIERGRERKREGEGGRERSLKMHKRVSKVKNLDENL
jgi:hypothetical protein